MFSPTAIADFLACQHLTALDRAERAKEASRPYFPDPGLELLIRLGNAHERTYLNQLAEQGLSVVEIPTEGSRREAAARTIKAIRGGADVIYQPTFVSEGGGSQETWYSENPPGPVATAPGSDPPWYGRADFLIRVEKASNLGPFSYEVVETKLARSTKARAIIQLCFYSDMLAAIQGVPPDFMHVVLGGGAKPEKFFVQRYLAFFRKIKRDFVDAQQAGAQTYPEPVEHCRICDWSTVCDAQWRKDDHLSLVANISRDQRQALIACGAETMAALASLPVPEPKIEGIKDHALANIHQQARLQVQGREERRNIYELLVPPEAEKGLCSLPAPSPGDVFLDFEGDRFTFEGGLEYLFGVLTIPKG